MPFLDRPLLDERIRTALRDGSIALHGSLGYGKTTLLRSALRGLDTPVARYDTAPWERDAFALPLVEAVAAVRPDFGHRTRALIESGASLEATAATFATDLAHIPAPIIIAIDDGGDIGDGAFRPFLRALAKTASSQVRIAIASRRDLATELGVPHTRFDEADLRFTADEIAQLLGTTDPSTVRRVVEATAGWPASVALTLAPETIPDITRAALEPFAVLERIDATRVASFRSLGAFVDLDERYVTLQPMVRDRLLSVMKARADGSLERAHRSAADDEESAGHYNIALYHHEQAGVDASTFAFLHRNVATFALSSDLTRVAAMLGRDDALQPNDRALALYVRALIEQRRGDADAGDHFAEAAELADTCGAHRVALFSRIRAIEFGLARGRGLNAHAIVKLRGDSGSAGPNVATAVAVLEGWGLAIRGEFARSLSVLKPHSAPLTTRDGSSLEILRAYVETSLGSIEPAKRRLDGLIAALETSEHLLLHVQALTWYARLALLWGETAIALDYANEAHRRSEGFEAGADSAALYAALAEASAHAGDAESTLRWSRDLRQHAQTAWYSLDAQRLAATSDQQMARALFARGDSTAARTVADAAADEADVSPASRAALLADAAAYAAAVADPSTSGAIARARTALDGVTARDAVEGVALANAAALLDALDIVRGNDCQKSHDDGSYATLVRAREGSLRLPTVATLIRQASHGKEQPQAVASALALFTARGPRFEASVLAALARSVRVDPTHAIRATMVEKLTDREMQVLESLVEGLTNREIAERLILGTRTIDTHVEHVLAKLGVTSRTRAIAAALRTGLVTPTPGP